MPSSQQPTPPVHSPMQSSPQSMFTSLPFFTPSKHVGAAHMHVFSSQSHTFERQSEECSHRSPVSHPLGQPPPQSSSVSMPFCTPSLHVVARQVIASPP